MNIIILQGNNSFTIQKRLSEILKDARKKGVEVLKPNILKLSDFKNILSSRSLFAKEQLFLLREIRNLSFTELEWVKEKLSDKPGEIVITSDTVIEKKIPASVAPLCKIETYTLPQILFKFFDSFYPKNARVCLVLLHQLEKTEPLEFIFSLLVKHVRDLYWVSQDASEIPYPSWRVLKLEKQSSMFTPQLLKNIIKELSDIDIKVKSSRATLGESLDLLIIKHLK